MNIFKLLFYKMARSQTVVMALRV
uniref:Uncharacterized protein n=1 Tax=Anguilla anguilla TaxID=7936 RepID=A0A0E9T5M6_ANGAN